MKNDAFIRNDGAPNLKVGVAGAKVGRPGVHDGAFVRSVPSFGVQDGAFNVSDGAFVVKVDGFVGQVHGFVRMNADRAVYGTSRF